MNKKFKPKFLMLLLTDSCNLNCAYCYRGEKSNFQDMPFEIAEKVLILANASTDYFHVQLTGGEPLLCPELIEKIAKFIYKNNFPATIGIQTNGILLDRTVVNLFKKYKIQVSISIDGPPEIQETLRGEANKVFANLKLLSENEIPFRITSVITNLNLKFLPKLLLLLSIFSNFEGIAWSFIVKKGKSFKNSQLNLPEVEEFKAILKEFLKTLDLINKVRVKPVTFRELEIFKKRIEKRLKEPFCMALKKESLTVCPDGRLYPCSQTADDSNFFCGTLENPEVLGFLVLQKFSLRDFFCMNCKIENFCPEDCPSRTYYNREENKKLICAMYKILTEYLAK